MVAGAVSGSPAVSLLEELERLIEQARVRTAAMPKCVPLTDEEFMEVFGG